MLPSRRPMLLSGRAWMCEEKAVLLRFACWGVLSCGCFRREYDFESISNTVFLFFYWPLWTKSFIRGPWTSKKQHTSNLTRVSGLFIRARVGMNFLVVGHYFQVYLCNIRRASPTYFLLIILFFRILRTWVNCSGIWEGETNAHAIFQMIVGYFAFNGQVGAAP